MCALPICLALVPGRRAQGVDAVLEVGGSGRRRLPRLLADVAETVERRDALAIPGDQRIFVPRLCADLGVADDHAGCFDYQCVDDWCVLVHQRSEENTSELHSLMRISYTVFCLKQKHSQSTLNTSSAYRR